MKKLPFQIVTKTLFYAPTIYKDSVFFLASEKLIVIILTIYQCGGIVNIHSYLKSFCNLAVDVKTNVTIQRQISVSLLSLLT